ncbi:dTMP kinase [Alkalicoccus daliensis]|uniref:Thymidylate kinase n=1 Tax=Alkalicoccus daliensis TaxID=745820 RepID=A0A1H0KSM9_9BACI|nr:dTMP kinase [Alkalicoccus daliensis]SDO58949.1 dTMP kinase [Alkalicoccus daliensis]
MSGTFITFEGGEGAGKTTVLKELHKKLAEKGYDVLATREPGGSHIAEKIRDIILDPEHTAMDARTEALLYAASRRQHLMEKVVPHLARGGIILCDRFVDSSLVYQGFARKIGVEAVRELNEFATGGMKPDVTLYFDIDPVQGLHRIKENKGREINRLDKESLEFHQAVRDMYLQLQEREPERIKKIDAGRSLPEVTDAAWKVLSQKIQSN